MSRISDLEDQVLALLDERQEPYDKPLLPSVQQWLDWKLTNVLPKAGGTLDQDPEFMRDFRIICGLEAKWEKQRLALDKIRTQLKNVK